MHAQEFLPPEPRQPAAAAADDKNYQFDEIRSRLITDMFFAGELADKIIDAGGQDMLISSSPDDTRSEIRTKLILWIRANPDEAAKICLYIKETGSLAQPKIMEEPSKKIWWEFMPHFLAMTQDLSEAANRSGIISEDLSLAGKRIFEGLPSKNLLAIDNLEPAGSLPVNASVKPAAAPGNIPQAQAGPAPLSKTPVLSQLNWTLNKTTLKKEQKLAEQWLYELNKELRFHRTKEKDRQKVPGRSAPDPADPLLKERQKAIEKASAAWNDFIAKSSLFAGRIKIQRTEALDLEKTRLALRCAVSKCRILSRAYSAKSKTRLLENTKPNVFDRRLGENYSQQGKKLIEEASALSGKYYEISKDLTPENFRSGNISMRLEELRRDEEQWTAGAASFIEIQGIAGDLRRLETSCFFDKMMEKIILKKYPAASYSKNSKKLETYKTLIISAAEKLAEGDYAKARGIFTGADYEMHPGIAAIAIQAGNIRSLIAAARLASLKNCNMQAVFWNNLLYPLDVAELIKN